jgi:hypothetical protein
MIANRNKNIKIELQDKPVVDYDIVATTAWVNKITHYMIIFDMVNWKWSMKNTMSVE